MLALAALTACNAAPGGRPRPRGQHGLRAGRANRSGWPPIARRSRRTRRPCRTAAGPAADARERLQPRDGRSLRSGREVRRQLRGQRSRRGGVPRRRRRGRPVKAVRRILAAALLLVGPASLANATLVVVNGDGPNTGFNENTPAAPVGGNSGTTVGEQRLIVFQKAAAIWGEALDSEVPITILASWANLECNNTGAVLGSAGPTNFFSSDDPSLDGGVPPSIFPQAPDLVRLGGDPALRGGAAASGHGKRSGELRHPGAVQHVRRVRLPGRPGTTAWTASTRTHRTCSSWCFTSSVTASGS